MGEMDEERQAQGHSPVEGNGDVDRKVVVVDLKSLILAQDLRPFKYERIARDEPLAEASMG